MTRKRLICPQRLRTPPTQFSWVDHRLVRDGYIEQCDPTALALYLFLVTVADAKGLSYYADPTITRRLSLNQSVLEQARRSLITAQLIAYQTPIYQVLSLDGTSPSLPERQSTRPSGHSPHPSAQVTHEAAQRTQANRPVALAELLKLTHANTTDSTR